MSNSQSEDHYLNSLFHAERVLAEKGNVSLAALFVNKLASTPHSERVDVLRATTSILTGKPVVVESSKKTREVKSFTDYDATPEFSDGVTRLVASSMIALRERDEKLIGIVGLRKRDAQFTRGAEYLATSAPEGSIDTDVILPEEGDAVPGKQIKALEDYLGKPHKERNHHSLNPLSH